MTGVKVNSFPVTVDGAGGSGDTGRMATTTIPKARLASTDTDALIGQYRLAISSHSGRYGQAGPRQQRINHIVDLLLARAEDGDAVADTFFEGA